MNTKMILDISKLGISFLASSGINKIVKWSIENVTPEQLSKYEKLAVTVASGAISIAVTDIVVEHTDAYIDSLPETFNKLKTATMSVSEYLKTTVQNLEMIFMPNESSLTRLSDENMPGNSNASKKKTDIDEERHVKKAVIQSQPVTRKKSLGKKFTETFLGDEVQNVRQYVIFDVLLPAAKATLSDMVSQGLEMLLFGEGSRRGSNTRRDGGRSYVSYSNYYKSDRQPNKVNRRAAHNFDDIILETRGEAEEVLDNLVDLTVDYGYATVADLYDLVGISHNYTDRKWGWDNLNGATAKRVRDGYLLVLPKAKVIE